MSLYNMLFGVNRAAPVLLATLGLTESDVPRFRDCRLNGEGMSFEQAVQQPLKKQNSKE